MENVTSFSLGNAGTNIDENKNIAVTVAETVIKDTSANPAPIGLMGFGLTTVLLNLHNAGLFGIGSVILAMGIFYGGIAQIIAGMMEWKKDNTFGTLAFVSYGFFWLSLVAIILLPKTGIVDKPAPESMAAYLFLWGLLSLILLIATFKINKIMIIIFSLVTALFFLLALADATGSHAIKVFAGYEGIVCGFSAIYAAAAQVLNETYGREVLPLGKLK